MSDSLQPLGKSSWNSPDHNTGMDSVSFLEGIFPTQGSNPGLLHCRWILLPAEPQGQLMCSKMKFIVSHVLHQGYYPLVVLVKNLLLYWKDLTLSSVPVITFIITTTPSSSSFTTKRLLLRYFLQKESLKCFLLHCQKYQLFNITTGLPWWLSSKESAC